MIRHRIFRALAALWSRKPPDRMAAFLTRLAHEYIRRREPEAGLRFLLDLDARLYNLQNEAAMSWGNGTHPKHRIMNYHRFFIDRIQNNATVLDIGCGQGELAHAIATHTAATVTGIDRNPDHLGHAREFYRHERLQFVLADANQRLPVDRCDTVVLSNVLEHIRDRPRFLRHVIASTAPRQFLIRVPAIDRDWRVALKRELDLPYLLDAEHEIEYTKESLREELAEAGLHITETQCLWGEIWCEARLENQGTQR